MSFVSLFLFGLLAGILITWLFELILKTNKKLRQRYYKQQEVFWGYHVHHSTYGLIFLLVGIILFFNYQEAQALFFMGIATGIVLQHTVSEGRFVFIERWRK